MREIMSSINNKEQWEKDMGLKIERDSTFGDYQTMRITPPSRYIDLFKVAEENNELWNNFLELCFNYDEKVNNKYFDYHIMKLLINH